MKIKYLHVKNYHDFGLSFIGFAFGLVCLWIFRVYMEWMNPIDTMANFIMWTSFVIAGIGISMSHKVLFTFKMPDNSDGMLFPFALVVLYSFLGIMFGYGQYAWGYGSLDTLIGCLIGLPLLVLSTIGMLVCPIAAIACGQECLEKEGYKWRTNSLKAIIKTQRKIYRHSILRMWVYVIFTMAASMGGMCGMVCLLKQDYFFHTWHWLLPVGGSIPAILIFAYLMKSGRISDTYKEYD
jgi:divalent metal cation (Fe/Co/Zn/Cd) transporter